MTNSFCSLTSCVVESHLAVSSHVDDPAELDNKQLHNKNYTLMLLHHKNLLHPDCVLKTGHPSHAHELKHVFMCAYQ